MSDSSPPPATPQYDPPPPPKQAWWKRKLWKFPVWAWAAVAVALVVVVSTSSSADKNSETASTATTSPASIGATAQTGPTPTSAAEIAAVPPPSNATNTTAKPDTEPATAEADKGTRDNPIPLGTVADVGDGWTVKINAVELDGTDTVIATNEFNERPGEGKQYVVINATVGYTGPEASSNAGVTLSVLGNATNNPVASFDHFAVAPDPQLDSITELFKGGEETGNAVLLIDSADADSLVIFAEANAIFGGDRKFFSAS